MSSGTMPFSRSTNHDKESSLYSYGRNFPSALNQAMEDEDWFQHILLLLTVAVNDNKDNTIKFLHQWEFQWERFLTVTVPLYIFKITAGKCNIEYYFLVKSVLYLLDYLQDGSDYFCKIALQLLPYIDVTLKYLCKIVPEGIGDLEVVQQNMYQQFAGYVPGSSFPPELDDESNFRNLSIIPSSEDIHKKTPLLQPSIINGNYDDVEHYLSLCFRLNREDMLYGIRKGLVEYKAKQRKNEKLKDIEYVRIYKSVNLVKAPKYSVYGKLYEFTFQMTQEVEWDKTKRMKPGNLLCFSKDHFQTMTFVSISRRTPSEGKGKQCSVYVKVEGKGPVQDLLTGEDYVVIEPENYFEAYRHGLQILKSLSKENFPFPNYIVKPKAIALQQTIPECEINDFDGLDSRQKEAAKLALTSPISLIQGPPGTGKTYAALKILKCFLRNTKICPVIIICYTNHALDKFLEGVLQFNKKVIRMGSRSESEILKPHFLSKMLSAVDFSRSQKKEMSSELQHALEVARMVTPEQFPYNKTKSLKSFLLKYLEKELNEKLELLHKANSSSHLFNRDVLENMLNEAFKKSLMDGFDSSDIVLTVKEWLKGVGSDDSEIFENIKFISSVLSEKKDQYTGLVCKTENSASAEYVSKSNNPWDLPGNQRVHRFGLYLERFLKKLSGEIEALEDFHSLLTDHISRIEREYRYNYLKNADVIGFTTTGAAKNKVLLEMLKPKIFIVEEAAEIQEMHVVSSVPNSVEHLILIGDHEQLKPTPSCFQLGKDYNLNISLFERLFKNKIPNVRLEVQRRMRPSICRLLVPTIYYSLINHDVVKMYKNIRGVKSNIFFLNHTEPEENCATEKTHMNFHEATFIVALTYYFVSLQMYEKSKITILALYVGQQKLLKKLFEIMSLEDVEVSTVDGFQGEENHIIIISFVRSNPEEVIGFLNSSNRVCVALSRAMGGLYCIGNFELYSNKERFWNNLLFDLKKGEEYGEKFPLSLEGDNILNVVKAVDFVETCSDAQLQWDKSCDHEFFSKLGNLTMSEVLQVL